jgi:hypothetical protein
MASNIHVAAAYRKGMLDGTANIKTDANSGVLNIYSGTQPVDGDTALSGNTLLASLTMNATAFTGPSGTASTDQTLTAGAITSDSSADATGTATFFRLFKSDGTTKILDGSVGTSGSDLNLNTTSIVSAGTVAVTSLTLTLVK